MDTPSTITMCSTMNKKEKSIKTFIPQFFAAFAASISAFCMGTVEAYPSPGLPSMENSSKLGHISHDDQTKIASMALLAALLSGPPVGFLVGKVGRKSVLAISALPFVIGWLLIASTTNVPLIFFGRFITGFCAGTASLVVPIYIGEISSDEYRGFLCSLFQLSSTVGNFFVYVVGTVLDWQWLAFVCGMVPLFGLFLMSMVPSTPTFLLAKGGQDADAIDSLMWLRGASTHAEVEKELNTIQCNIIACSGDKKSYKVLLKMRTIRPLSICLFLLLFQQMTGIEVTLVFTVYIFQSSGVRMDPYISTIIVGFVQIIATLASALLVDLAGRRLLLIISQLGVCVSMLALVLFFHYKGAHSTHADEFGYDLDWLPLTSMCLFIAFFAIGAGPVPFLLLAELNSSAVIGFASSVGTTLTWTFAYMVTDFFLDIEDCIGLEWCFGIFSGFSLLGAAYVYMFVPETRGKSKEEIQNYFRKKKKTDKISKVKSDCSISFSGPKNDNDCINRNDGPTRY